MDCPCMLFVFSIQMRQFGHLCRASLISLFNIVSRCKILALVPFDPFDILYWAPLIKLLESERLESQYFFDLYSCTVALNS